MIVNDCIQLRYKMPRDTGNYKHWWRDQKPKQFTASNKMGLPLFRCLYKDFSILHIDFDKMPQGMSKEEFAAIVFTAFAKFGVKMAESASGKVKAFILVEHIGYEFTSADARRVLMEITPEELKPFVDVCDTALRQCYFTQSCYDAVMSLTDPIVVEKREDDEQPVVENNVVRLKDRRPYKINQVLKIPKCLHKFIKKGDPRRELFIRFLFATPSLLKDTGFNISMNKCATICGVNVNTINLWIKELIALGWLECIDGSFAMFKKAKTYRATGVLKMYLKQEYAYLTMSPVLKRKYEKGNRFVILYSLTKNNLHLSVDEIVKLARVQIPDIDRHGESQIRRSYKCFMKKVNNAQYKKAS